MKLLELSAIISDSIVDEIKHLPGRHDQSTHGRVGGSGAYEKPKTKADEVLYTGLDQVSKLMAQNSNIKDWKYKGGYDLVLKEGCFFTPKDRPPNISKEKDRECFRNAALLALSNEDYNYVEGFAVSEGLEVIPIHHAWCADKNNNVVDPTWKTKGTSYIGIKFSSQFLEETVVKNKIWGLIPEMPMKNYNPFKDGFPQGAIIQ